MNGTVIGLVTSTGAAAWTSAEVPPPANFRPPVYLFGVESVEISGCDDFASSAQ